MSEPRRRSSGRWKKTPGESRDVFFCGADFDAWKNPPLNVYNIWIHVLFKRMKGKYEHLPDASKLKHIMTLHNYFWAPCIFEMRCPKKHVSILLPTPGITVEISPKGGHRAGYFHLQRDLSWKRVGRRASDEGGGAECGSEGAWHLGTVAWEGFTRQREWWWKLVVVYIIPNSIGVKIGPQ